MSRDRQTAGDHMATKIQAEELLCSEIQNPEEKEIVRQYVRAFELRGLKRKIEIFRRGYLKYGLARNVGMFLAL